MAKDPAFLLYYKDILVSCADWEPNELGWYMRLICHQADKPEGLPDDIEALAQLAGVKISQYTLFCECFKRTLKAKFETNALGKLVNKRLSQVLSERGNYVNKQALRGTVGYFIKQAKKQGIEDENTLHLLSEALFLEIKLEHTKEERDVCFKRTLKALLVNANAIGNKDEIEIEEKKQSAPNFQNQTGQTPGLANLQPIETLPRPAHWPDQDTVEQYFISKGSDHKADQKKGAKFFHHYEAQSWHTSGGMPVTRWRAKADEWISSPNKFDTPEKTKVEITPDDYAEIPKTSSHYVRAN